MALLSAARRVLILIAIIGSPLTSCQTKRTQDEDSLVAEGIEVRAGYVEFMDPARLAPFKRALPTVSDNPIQQAMSDPNTMWYDDKSMVFSYQDGVETVVGLRANRVGYETGNRNRNNPQIAKLMTYFQPGKFKFPFATALGTDYDSDVFPIQFWLPPRENGRALPVKWWQRTQRGHWHWVFPNGTIFGEVLFKRGPGGRMYPFEVRTRLRYSGGWAVNAFRPFTTAESLAQAIIRERPQWQSTPTLRALVEHLRNPATLVSWTMTGGPYAPIFAAIPGALDWLPDANDPQLIGKLLSETTFVSAEGAIWKQHGDLETYAPTTNAGFHIVPKQYTAGVVAVNEVSCNRCHQDTGRQLGELDSDVQLYGEIWGEDRIFTWHPFQDHRGIYGTFDDTDGSRIINPRLQQAGLIKQERVGQNDPRYKELPRRFQYRFR